MKKVNKIWLAISALLAFAAAGCVFYFSYTAYDRLVATTTVVVAARDIEPYTLITPAHLDAKEMPRAILDEDVYASVEAAVGRIATSRIPGGGLVYRPLVVPPARFRYVEDPDLEVVSIPVDPARAVGGQIRIGHVVNVYRAARSPKRPEASDPMALLNLPGAAVELLTSAPVVDVRNSDGDALSHETGASQTQQEVQTRGRPTLDIVTLGVTSDIAADLIQLAVEQRGDYELWLSLAPASAAIDAADAVEGPFRPPWARAEDTPQGTTLTWAGSDGVVGHYVIFRWDKGEEVWQPVTSVPIEEDGGGGEYAVVCPESDTYGVAAVGPDGEQSAITAAVASERAQSTSH